MPRSAEIDYYSKLLASLTVTAARATSAAVLRKVHDELEQAYSEIFVLLSHDAERAHLAELSRSAP